MKTVFYTKDAYKSNTVRVNYYEKNATKTNLIFIFDEETEETVQSYIGEEFDKLLFCQRLEWVESENELDNYIEEVRQYWENRINT